MADNTAAAGISTGGNKAQIAAIDKILTGEAPEAKPDDVVEADATADSVADATGESSEQTGESQTDKSVEAEADAGAEKPIKFADLAKGLGVEPGDLYDVEISLAEGREPVTLGEMKDAYQDQAALTEKVDALAERESKSTNKMMQARRQLEELVQLLPEGIPPEMVARAEALDAEKVKTEQRLILEVIPEWGNAAQLAADSKLIRAHLLPYGFTDSEIGMIQDHRLAKYVLDQAKREQRVTDAGKSADSKKTSTNTGKRGARRGPKADRMQKLHEIAKSGRDGQIKAVSSILSGE